MHPIKNNRHPGKCLLCSALLALFQYHDRNIFRVRYEVINHKHLLFIRKILHL
uniref:Uncharacterized protein n=1 Tax=Escherichia coli TaxID=562 RepID=A0A288XFM2_ECOLX|nr:hypothetical protein [Escherichia coli]